MNRLEASWYERKPLWWALPLTLPLKYLYHFLSSCNAKYKKTDSKRVGRPVIIVGNISIGGTGKTPFTLWLVERLVAAGYKPGIVSRGYGGERTEDLMLVTPHSNPAEVGDEPALMAQRNVCPVMVGKERVKAAAQLIDMHHVDVIISDDGLQHYNLQRDYEFCIVDGQRGLGNRHLLPVGPLREKPSRLLTVDAVVSNGDLVDKSIIESSVLAKQKANHTDSKAVEFATMHLATSQAINLLTEERRDLTAFAGQTVTALAGIGNPERFFNTLTAIGMLVDPVALPDHYHFSAEDIPNEGIIFMTEKDAVKCKALVKASNYPHCWMVPVNATLTKDAETRIMRDINNVLSRASNRDFS